MYTLFDRMEQILAGNQGRSLAPEVATEEGAVDRAMEVSTSLYTGGLKAGLTGNEVSQGLDDVADARSSIVTNPDLCVDPYWNAFLHTLDDLEAALENTAAVHRSGI
jgi:hypothetical protein